MMRTRQNSPGRPRALAAVLAALACVFLAAAPAFAQATSGETQIQNRASATYSDGSNTYSVTSNTVTVTVANVAGLTITPDGGSVPTVVAGQTSVDFTFTVTNSGNFPTQVRFPNLGGAIFTNGPITVTGARIDLTGNGYDNGDTDILGNNSPVLYPASPYLARNASFNVIVRVSVNASANPNDAIGVRLGDAAADNVNASMTETEVRTSVPPGKTLAGSESEAVGNITTSVENDARLQVSLAVPAGPVALGSNINYSATLRNVGLRPAATQTLQGGPAGANTGVFVVVPIPAGTTLQSVPAPPAGVTVLYSVSPLGVDPGPGDPPASGPLSNAVVWTTTAPGVLSSTTRVAFRVNSGNALPANYLQPNLDLMLTVQTGINASSNIWGIAEAFARNSLNSPLTDQSDNAGADVPNKGDGNANFNEPKFGVDPLSATKGFQQKTLLTLSGSVLIGPSGAPGAVGPSSNNDDYTNRTVPFTAVANKSYQDTLSAAVSVNFVNTIQNVGNADDTYTITVPTFPTNFTVEISTDGGTTFVPASSNPTVAVAFNATANIIVRVTTTAAAAVLQGFTTEVVATSANTPAQFNKTLDRLYTGFLKLQKAATVFNNTPVGNNQSTPGPDDAVPGADIEYVISYSNITVGGGGAGCVDLTASSVVIDENGTTATNNWAVNTTQVTSPMPADVNTTGSAGTVKDQATGAAVTGTTSWLQDFVPNLGPGQGGTFTFRRRIK